MLMNDFGENVFEGDNKRIPTIASVLFTFILHANDKDFSRFKYRAKCPRGVGGGRERRER